MLDWDSCQICYPLEIKLLLLLFLLLPGFTYSRWCPKWLPDYYMSDSMFQPFSYVV